MDVALLKKMKVYAPDSHIVGLPDDSDAEESTLIKADISIFHKLPEQKAQPAHQSLEPVESEAEPVQLEEAEPASPEPAAPEPPRVSDYDAGFEAGKANAQAMHQSTIDLLQKTVSSLQSDIQSIVKDVERAHLSFVSKAMQAAFPALIDAAVSAELIKLFEQGYAQAGKGNVSLLVSPGDHEKIATLCTEKKIRITVIADEEIEPGQMRAVWGQGGGDINCQEIANSCLKYVEDTLEKLT